jgi:hypothetical protein
MRTQRTGPAVRNLKRFVPNNKRGQLLTRNFEVQAVPDENRDTIHQVDLTVWDTGDNTLVFNTSSVTVTVTTHSGIS